MKKAHKISHNKFTKLTVLGAVALGGHYIALMEPKKTQHNARADFELKPGEKESISEIVTKKVYLYVKSIEAEGQHLQSLMGDDFNKVDMNSSFVKEQVKKTIEQTLKDINED